MSKTDELFYCLYRTGTSVFEYTTSLRAKIHDHNANCDIFNCPDQCGTHHTLDLEPSIAWTVATLLESVMISITCAFVADELDRLSEAEENIRFIGLLLNVLLRHKSTLRYVDIDECQLVVDALKHLLDAVYQA